MNVACCQLDITWEDKRANHARVKALVETARLPAGTLLLLPEMFDTGFSMNVAAITDGADLTGDLTTASVSAPGQASGAAPAASLSPSCAFLCDLAIAHGLFIIAGLVTTGSDGRGRNQAVTFAPDGREVFRCTKLHSFGIAGETAHFTPGTGAAVTSLAGWKVAPLICYDLRFPETFRAGVRRGAELFAVIANWPASRELHWVTLLRARAIENQAYVAGVNRCGGDPHASYTGRSLIIDPRGEIVAEAAAGEQIICGRLDLTKLQEYRQRFPALKDMRADLI